MTGGNRDQGEECPDTPQSSARRASSQTGETLDGAASAPAAATVCRPP